MKSDSIFHNSRDTFFLSLLPLIFVSFLAPGQELKPCPTPKGINRAICCDDAVDGVLFRVSGQTRATIKWYKADGVTEISTGTSKTELSAADFDPTHTTLSRQEGGRIYEVKVTQTYDGCRESAKKSVYLVQQPLLRKPEIPSSSSGGMCNGNEITLTSDEPISKTVSDLTLYTEILWNAPNDTQFGNPSGKYSGNTASARISIIPEPSPNTTRSFAYKIEYKEGQTSWTKGALEARSCPSIESAGLAITVWPRPRVTNALSLKAEPSTVCRGGIAALTLNGSTDGTIKEWSSSSVIASQMTINSTGNVLSQPFSTAGSYTYQVVFTKNNGPDNMSCDLRSPSVTVTVLGNLTTPLDVSKCAGEDAEFSSHIEPAPPPIPANSTLPSFKWEVEQISGQGFKNVDEGTTTTEPGRTGSKLVIDKIPVGYDGYNYRLVVKYTSTCTLTGEPATLHVKAPPVISTNLSAELPVCRGENFTLQVSGTGTGQIVCQWERKLSGDPDFTNPANPEPVQNMPPGSFTASLNIPATDNPAGASYRVKITDENNCPVYSAPCTIQLKEKPSFINDNPLPDVSVCEGNSAVFKINRENIRATGDMTFTWHQIKGVPVGIALPPETELPAGTEVGTNSDSFTLSPASQGNNGDVFRVKIRNGNCPLLVSNPARLTVVQKPSVTQQPVNFTDPCDDSSEVSFTVDNGIPGSSIQYQWEEAAPAAPNTFVEIPAAGNSTATAAKLILSGVTSAKNGSRYRVKLTNQNQCFSYSETVSLTKYAFYTVNINPSTPKVCVGQEDFTCTASATTTAADTPTPAYEYQYQWKKWNAAANDFENIPGATTAQYIIPPVSVDPDDTQYRVDVKIAGTGCQRRSAPSKLQVYPYPHVELQPQNQSFCSDDNATFTVRGASAKDNDKLSYQWQENNGNEFIDLTGETNADLVLHDVAATKNGNRYMAIISNGVCSTASDPATLELHAPPVTGTLYGPSEICKGNDYTYTLIGSSGGTLKYQLQIKNNNGAFENMGKAVPHTTTYELKNLQATATYRVMVQIDGTSCQRPTPESTLTVNSLPTFGVEHPVGCADRPMTLRIVDVKEGTGSYTYKWKEGGTELGHENFYTFTPALNTHNNTKWTAVVTDSKNCSAPSNFTLSVINIPTAMAKADPEVICSATATHVVLSNHNQVDGDGTAFTWVRSEQNTISGPPERTTPSPGPIEETLTSSATRDVKVTYTVTPVAHDCVGTSIPVEVTVHPPPDVQAPANLTLCTGREASIKLTTRCPDTKYTWSVQAPAEVTGWQNQSTAAGDDISQTLTSSSSQNEKVVYTITPFIGDCKGRAIEVPVTVQSEVKITPLVSAVTICPGASMRLEAGAKGSPPMEYQWQRDGQNIPDANQAVYTMPVSDGDNGAKFKAVVKNLCNEITSGETELTVSPELVFANSGISVTPSSPAYAEPARFVYKGAGGSGTEGTPFTFDWDFGDHTVHSNFEDPVHNYTALGPQVVNLTLTAPDNCHKTFTLRLTVTGKEPDVITADPDNPGIAFYPVPLAEKLHLHSEQPMICVSVYTITGSRLIRLPVSGKEGLMDTSTLTPGIYILSVETEKGISRFKVVK